MDHVTLRIGVLAMQGAFEEHLKILENISRDTKGRYVHVLPFAIRKASDLDASNIDGLIIPGGESTTMSLVAERLGIWTKLLEWVDNKRPTWGTCAGLILLAKEATSTKKDGQSLLEGLSIHVDRNYYGSQSDSFTWPLNIQHQELKCLSSDPFMGVFIRAPMITRISECDNTNDSIRILATLPVEARPDKNWIEEPIVAVREKWFLGTAFHPELTNGTIWHEYFITMIYDCYKHE